MKLKIKNENIHKMSKLHLSQRKMLRMKNHQKKKNKNIILKIIKYSFHKKRINQKKRIKMKIKKDLMIYVLIK